MAAALPAFHQRLQQQGRERGLCSPTTKVHRGWIRPLFRLTWCRSQGQRAWRQAAGISTPLLTAAHPPPARASSQAAASQPSTSQGDDDDVHFMRLALQVAQLGYQAGEVPVGAVLVHDGQVLSSAHNLCHSRQSPVAHAEMLCIMEAAEQLQAWRLLDATLYVTLEPCPMCAGAILQSRLRRLVYGARQPRLGADGSWISMFPSSTRNSGVGGASDAGQHSAGCPGGRMSDAGPGRAGAGPEHPFHTTLTITRGVLELECGQIMKSFFKERRGQATAVDDKLDPSHVAPSPKCTRSSGVQSKLGNDS